MFFATFGRERIPITQRERKTRLSISVVTHDDHKSNCNSLHSTLTSVTQIRIQRHTNLRALRRLRNDRSNRSIYADLIVIEREGFARRLSVIDLQETFAQITNQSTPTHHVSKSLVLLWPEVICIGCLNRTIRVRCPRNFESQDSRVSMNLIRFEKIEKDINGWFMHEIDRRFFFYYFLPITTRECKSFCRRLRKGCA